VTLSGAEGEAFAADYLIKNGYRILEQNYRTSLGEIDIIARDGETLVFIEVKARSSARFGAPQLAVDHRKQVKISRVALAYLSRKKGPPGLCRFDVLALRKDRSGFKAELIRNAFDGAFHQ